MKINVKSIQHLASKSKMLKASFERSICHYISEGQYA